MAGTVPANACGFRRRTSLNLWFGPPLKRYARGRTTAGPAILIRPTPLAATTHACGATLAPGSARLPGPESLAAVTDRRESEGAHGYPNEHCSRRRPQGHWPRRRRTPCTTASKHVTSGSRLPDRGVVRRPVSRVHPRPASVESPVNRCQAAWPRPSEPRVATDAG
jgi:hypothetical protein